MALVKYDGGCEYRGVGMNLEPSPSKDCRLRGGCKYVVKSWNAMLFGLAK